jgi:hypothetical protein
VYTLKGDFRGEKELKSNLPIQYRDLVDFPARFFSWIAFGEGVGELDLRTVTIPLRRTCWSRSLSRL